MSIEKVRRYVFTGDPGGVGVGMRGDLLVNDPAHPVAVNRTEYIEYADVGGLVEALREIVRTGNQADLSDYSARHIMREAAENELARWQS